MPQENKQADSVPFTDYKARKEVAEALLESCRAERYVYLFFSAIAAAGVLVALVIVFMQKTFTLTEVGMLSGSGGAIALSANRILKIQHDLFRVVFGINL